MDFTKFSDENFDLKEWINSAFVAQKDTNQNLEQFVATFVTKLQVFIQEINNSIDDTSQQTVQNFPRILREIDVLKQEAFVLKEQMKNVRDDLLKVEKNTVNESMKLLLDLDIMRTNMLNVQLSLQEADNWTTLTSDLDSILQSRDVNAISNHIEAMHSSLALLQDDSVDYMSRCALLEDFKNKFETFMTPEIVSSFNSKSIEQSKNYVQIFGQMNRLNDLKKYYYQCEKAKVLEKHAQLLSDMSVKTTASGTTLTAKSRLASFGLTVDGVYIASDADALHAMLSNWLEFLLEVWQNETQWCKHIFNDSHAIVINLLTRCFEESNKNLVRLFDALLANSAKAGPDGHLNYLNNYKQESDRFASAIYTSVESSSLLKNSQYSDLLHKLLQQVYMPYKVCTKQYSQLVVSHLQWQLETQVKMSHPDTVECVQLLRSSVTKVFNLIEVEIERCMSLTNGSAFAMLIESFKVFLKNYIEEFKRVVVNLKERKLDAAQSPATATIASTGSHLSQPSAFSATSSSSSSSTDEDWETFRHIVKIIQIVGELIIKNETLEDALEIKIAETFIHRHSTAAAAASEKTRTISISLGGLNATSADDQSDAVHHQLQQEQNDLLSVVNYKNYLLEDAERLKLNKLIAAIESGDDYSIMKDLLKPMFLLSEHVHKYGFDIVFLPVKHLLTHLSMSRAWVRNEPGKPPQQQQQSNEAIPLFALAPQEYITKIGQYLLTLPQNFEPFTMQDNANLIVALHKGKLPFLEEKDVCDDITACWLDSIANATVVMFCDEILHIQNLSVNSQRQLIIDIEFICSVFEDVGLKDFNNLNFTLELLKVDRDDFEDSTANKPARIVSAVRRMRGF